jgi:hypothetical protein
LTCPAAGDGEDFGEVNSEELSYFVDSDLADRSHISFAVL